MNWDEYFIKQAMLCSEKSKDPSTKVGCVLVSDDNYVLATGFNGFPRGIAEEEEYKYPYEEHPQIVLTDTRLIPSRWERPTKYSFIEHAERNAIYNAARQGVSLLGSRAYLNWMPNATCADCTRALIQVGIKEIIGPDIPFGGVGNGTHYTTGFADELFGEAGIKIRVVKWKQQEV